MSVRARETLNVTETAKRLGVHKNTVRNWADKGVLHALRLPGSGYRRFSADEVERIMRSMEADLPLESEAPSSYKPRPFKSRPADAAVE